MRKKLKIVVWGGSGFLGSHVCDNLTENGHHIIIADIQKSEWQKPKQKMVLADITNYNEVDSVTKGADYVFNFAGIADINEANKNMINTVNVNIKGNINVLKASIKHKIKRYIFSSTLYVYSDSGGFYKCSKQSCEQYIQECYKQFKLNFNILRFGTLYGPRSDKNNSINYFINQIIRNRKIIYQGKANSIREYIHVKDAANICNLLLGDQYKNQHFILTGNESIKVKDTIRMISEILQIKKTSVVFNKGNKKDHYEYTPYSYIPSVGKKFINTTHIDFGQGIMHLIDNIKSAKKLDVHK